MGKLESWPAGGYSSGLPAHWSPGSTCTNATWRQRRHPARKGAAPDVEAASKETILGHPKALFVLFFSEMWERFSFYGMRALLVLYMTKAMMYEETHATQTYGAYTGLVYATPLFGGLLADRLLGYRKAILIGGVLMALGHFALAVPHRVFFYGALALIVAGNGMFKPNISTLVGTLYPAGDPRRDGGFTIFYMGINLGAFLAPLLCGLIGEKVGWHYGFGLAGIGMIFGLAVFKRWEHLLGQHGLPPRPEALKEPFLGGLGKLHSLYLACLLFVPLVAYTIYQVSGVQYAVATIAGGFVVYILYEALRSNREEQGRIVVITTLICFSVVFWACFEQAGSSMTLFTDKLVDRTILGWEVPASVFQSVNPFFIMLLAIPFSYMWAKLGAANRDPSAPVKFAFGIIIMATGFIAMVIAAKQAVDGQKASLIWLVLAYFLHTTGELCLSPVGLSAVTKMAPTRLVGMMMGLWFVSNAAANVLAGIIAGMTGGEEGYERVFTMIVYFAIGAGVVLLMLSPILKKLSHGAK